MEKEHLNYLYKQYMLQKASPSEMEEWEGILRDPKLKLLLDQVVDRDYYSIPDAEIQELDGNRSTEIFNYIISRKVQGSPATIRLWPKILVAAAAVAIIVMSVVFFNYYRYGSDQDLAIATAHILPGKQGANLTLANGKKIRLNDVTNGELAKEAGVRINKTSDGQIVYEIVSSEAAQGDNDGKPSFNTLSTGNGETYQVTLPDKSKVWLNAASSIKYPASFLGAEKRSVQLEGEAYFEIAKVMVKDAGNKMHRMPFVVETVKQKVEVLGTHFNINSYIDNAVTKTTLLEGSVQVSAFFENNVVLKPGQQSLLSSKSLKVKEVEPSDAVSWKNGYFMFNNEDLGSIMKTLSRWYNTRIVYEDESLKNELVFAKLSRYENIYKILKVMERTEIVKFKVEGNTIIISRK